MTFMKFHTTLRYYIVSIGRYITIRYYIIALLVLNSLKYHHEMFLPVSFRKVTIFVSIEEIWYNITFDPYLIGSEKVKYEISRLC
jgi:hypothetical protein